MLYTISTSSGKGTQDYGLLFNESNGSYQAFSFDRYYRRHAPHLNYGSLDVLDLLC